MTPLQVSDLFTYHNGWLIWNKTVSPRGLVGTIAGSKNRQSGYWEVRAHGKNYRVHRLIFLAHHGYLPAYVDHKDGNLDNNMIENLRDATPTQNQYNKRIGKNNTSGYKGVSWEAGLSCWRAAIRWDGKRKIIGRFKHLEDAVYAVQQARLNLHGEFARDE